MIPIGDDQVHGGSPPVFTALFLAANVLVFLFEISLPAVQLDSFVTDYGTIPLEIANGEDYFTLFTSMFLHGGWMHLIGNMVFLWIFGDNIEAAIGHVKYVLFYLLGGLAASATHIMMDPMSSIPTVGASGAIAALLGAYLVLFPGSRIRLLIPVIFSTVRISALFFLGFWIVQQVISGMGWFGLSGAEDGGGVAWWAHIGGFVFGVIIGLTFKLSGQKVYLRMEG